MILRFFSILNLKFMMCYKKYLLVILMGLFFGVSSSVIAQENDSKSTENENNKSQKREKSNWAEWKEQLFFGGNFQLDIGDITIIDISPIVGMQVTDQMQVGVGLTYQYYRQRAGTYTTTVRGVRYTYTVEEYQTSIYGGRLFGRYFFAPTMFAHAETEALNYAYEDVTDYGYERRRTWVPGVFVGGGYNQPFSRLGGLNLTVLYNLTYDKLRSPYNSPWVVRMGFTL